LADGVLSKDAYRDLLRLVTKRLDVFHRDGLNGLMGFVFGLGAPDRNEATVTFLTRHFLTRMVGRLHHLTNRLEVLLHLKLALEELAPSSFTVPVSGLIRQWLVEAARELQTFFRAYPHYGAAVQAAFIADAIKARSSTIIRQLFDASIISGVVRTKAERQVAAIHAQGLAAARNLLTPTRTYLIGRVPMFHALPRNPPQQIADFGRTLVVPPRSVVVREGEEGHSFFVVTAGLLEVHRSGEREEEPRPRLFAGDFFGEASLVFGQPRNATVIAVMTTELL